MGNLLKSGISPVDYSRHEPTGNHAIDLVAQAIGYHRAAHRPLKTIYLAHTKWLLFVEGMRVLHHMKRMDFDHHSEFTFEGVFIKEGGRYQIETMKYEYIKLKSVNN